MGKLVVTEFVSLDGVVESPQSWSLEYRNDEARELKRAELFAADALLLGRVTYDHFAASWPGRAGIDDYADRMNALPRFVASTTLREVGWRGTELLGPDVVADVHALKARFTGDVLVFGSNVLVPALLAANLVDEVRVLSYPVLVGQGRRLFEGATCKLELVSMRGLPRGLTWTIYRPLAPRDVAVAA